MQSITHTLYQVSTATALVEGVYQGAVPIAELRKHGNLGLGTFENLDGEMVIIDGHFFQVRSDGSVREVDDSVLTPFATITAFSSGPPTMLHFCPDLAHLTSRFDTLRNSDNLFFALRVDGRFDHVHSSSRVLWGAFTGSDGNSHVVHGSVSESKLVEAQSILFKETPPHSSFDWHNDPIPQYVLTLAVILAGQHHDMFPLRVRLPKTGHSYTPEYKTSAFTYVQLLLEVLSRLQ
jgi:Alpha-acetolactate decarboxylase